MCPCPHSQAQGETDGEAEWHNAALDFTHAMSYGDYLKLDKVLDAQFPLSPDHNEMLFIIQHQTSELWMKLMLHELRAAREHVKSGKLGPALKMLARVSRIFDQLVHAWAVLATMTPTEYNTIRPYLGQSSGFQSYQYREIEFILGNKNATLLKPHAHRAELLAALEQAPAYAVAIRRSDPPDGRPGAAGKPGAARPGRGGRHLLRGLGGGGVATGLPGAGALLGPVSVGGKLIDLEDSFRQWRFRHVTTVERIIGFKPGTGGTEGVGYLRSMLDTILFPELWRLRSNL